MTISDFIERKMKEFEKRFTVKTFSTTGEMRIMAGGKIQEGKMLVYHRMQGRLHISSKWSGKGLLERR